MLNKTLAAVSPVATVISGDPVGVVTVRAADIFGLALDKIIRTPSSLNTLNVMGTRSYGPFIPGPRTTDPFVTPSVGQLPWW